jgi:hypothetical protein
MDAIRMMVTMPMPVPVPTAMTGLNADDKVDMG